MYKIAILSGDGIGPEVMEQTERVLRVLEKKYSITIDKQHALVGGIAIDKQGTALPQETLTLCEQSNAILFGSVGGPKWDALPPQEQPERAALLFLRKHFNLFANLRPAIIFDTLQEASPLKAKYISSNLDLLIVRELTSGIYFGKKERTDTYASDTLMYNVSEIERIAHVAFQLAQGRNKQVTSVDKANVLTSMVLWREVVESVAVKYPEVTLSHLYVDNAAMQLILRPNQFDVLLCPNMFGDILSDEASIITGSLGMLPSASLGETKQSKECFGLYEPAGGSAPDIAGKNIANPIAQILSLALLFKYSFNIAEAYDVIFSAVRHTLQAGFRTKDIMSTGCISVSTEEMGTKIVEELTRL